MLQILNRTPFAAGLALLYDRTGAEVVTAVAKATFRLPRRPDERCTLAEEQIPVLYTDEYLGEPGVSSLRRPADVVLGKPCTDIGLVGTCRSPTGNPVASMSVLLEVGTMRQVLLVTGDRTWGVTGPSRPEPFLEMPLSYERSYGGVDPDDRVSWDPRNPVGRGFYSSTITALGCPLPNLEVSDRSLRSATDRPPIAGFGFVAPHWESRRRHAGTYDETWRRTRAPMLPDDYDPRFASAAAPGWSTNGHLQGGERVSMNLGQDGEIAFALPKGQMRMTCRLGNDEEHSSARLWTLGLEPDDGHLYMVWGHSFSLGKQPSRMRYIMLESNVS